MMKNILRVCLIAACFVQLPAFAENQQDKELFKLPPSSYNRKCIINKSITRDTLIQMGDKTDALEGLGVSMRIIKKTPRFFVKIILTDEKGARHLVADLYREVTEDKDTIYVEDYCEETQDLSGVKAGSLALYVRNAQVDFSSITIKPFMSLLKNSSPKEVDKEGFKRAQVQAKVDKINEYNNNHEKLWTAGVTSLSLMSYSDKMRVLCLPDSMCTNGIEYYAGGIFEIGEMRENEIIQESPYVDEFDWTNRHGKNWMTPIRGQGHSNYCTAFATAACAEALTNLYYNRPINLDLSEQQIACCCGAIKPYTKGMYHTLGVEYLSSYGVCDEMSYPFVDDSLAAICRTDEITPLLSLKINGYSETIDNDDDLVKKFIIEKGPVISGFGSFMPDTLGGPDSLPRRHAMALVGYGTIHVGDSIRELPKAQIYTDYYCIPEGSPLIGKTYWKFKNSNEIYENDDIDGYMYLMIHDKPSMIDPISLNFPFEIRDVVANTLLYTSNDVVCEDADGDGYYFWGLGPKPTNIPSWIPDEPDGDDSDPNMGPMDAYGYLRDLSEEDTDTIFITNTEYEMIPRHCRKYIVVTNGATWNIENDFYFHNGVKVIVQHGGKLLVANHAQLTDIEMVLEPGGNLSLGEGAVVYLRQGTELYVPIGATLNVNNAEILHGLSQ